jgi:hypothetical protein
MNLPASVYMFEVIAMVGDERIQSPELNSEQI